MDAIVTGIQQIGVGVADANAAFRWYRAHFGLDIPVFDDAAEADLMVRYTGGKAYLRRAILALNLAGGGGLEIWQFTSREPVPSPVPVRLGDTGIYAARIKARGLRELHARIAARSPDAIVTPLVRDPLGSEHFFVRDPFGNLFQLVVGREWFRAKGDTVVGGVAGCLVGVTDIDRALALYRDVLGYDRVLYDREGVFDDLARLPGGDVAFRRVLLVPSGRREGRFSRLLGESAIELCHTRGPTPRRIFEGRFWGDLGFIHVCFDVTGMDALRARCERHDRPFTIDSQSSFSMASAAGRFAYVEDPDGTLVEFVETHRVPIYKRF